MCLYAAGQLRPASGLMSTPELPTTFFSFFFSLLIYRYLPTYLASVLKFCFPLVFSPTATTTFYFYQHTSTPKRTCVLERRSCTRATASTPPRANQRHPVWCKTAKAMIDGRLPACPVPAAESPGPGDEFTYASALAASTIQYPHRLVGAAEMENATHVDMGAKLEVGEALPISTDASEAPRRPHCWQANKIV